MPPPLEEVDAQQTERVFRGSVLSCDADPYPLRCRDFPRRGKQEKVKSEEVIVKK